MSELLESRWQDTKTALLEGLDGNKKGVMATTLENTRKYLSETAVAGTTSAGNVATLNRVILPVIRRVMPTVIANELVGVQPMTGPVGQIHTLRVRYSDTVGSGASGASAGEEASYTVNPAAEKYCRKEILKKKERPETIIWKSRNFFMILSLNVLL